MKVLTAIQHLILVQTFYFIAPYWIRDGRVYTSKFATIWTLVGGSGFLFVVWYSVRAGLEENSMGIRFQNGYLWGIIATFEFTFTNVAFPMLLAHGFWTRRQQINFFNRIADMDVELELDLGIFTGPMNRRLRYVVLFFMFLTFMYFNSLWFCLLVVLGTMRYMFSFGILLFLVCNQVEQFAMGLLTWSMVSSMMLLRCRFRLLRNVEFQLRPDNERDAVEVMATRQRMAHTLRVYKRLVLLMDDFSRIMGNVMVLRFAHDFTLLVSQIYIVFYLLSVYDAFFCSSIVFVVLWSMQNVVKIFVTTLAAHLTVLEVRFRCFRCGFLKCDVGDEIVDFHFGLITGVQDVNSVASNECGRH